MRPVTPANTLKHIQSQEKMASELRHAFANVRLEFWTAGIFSFLINALMLMPSIYMLQIYDRVMVSRNEWTLLLMTILLAAVLGAVAVVEAIRSRLMVRTGVKLDQLLSERLFRACFNAQLQVRNGNPAQTLADLTTVRQFLTSQGVFAFFDAPWFFIYLLVLFVLHPMLGWLGVASAFVLLVIAWFSHAFTSSPAQAAVDAGVLLNADLSSKLRNAESIEAMGMLPRLRSVWWRKHIEQLKAQAKLDSINHKLVNASKFFRYTQQSVALAAGAWLVIQGEINVGAMIVSNLLMSRALQPLDMLVSSWRNLQFAQSSLKRISNIFLQQSIVSLGRLTQVPFGTLDLRNISATASGKLKPILVDINLFIPSGSVMCVLGPSGSGKSTLVQVMLGIWPTFSGEIFLDSEPLDGWDREILGNSIGYLPQEVALMEGTLAQNIARFGPLDSEKVIAAAQQAGIHQMVLRFPNGYDTPAGEAGNLLSAGQRQRLALARALYGNPSLLVLDEPNANLDETGEQALLEAICTLKSLGKTIILITHRKKFTEVADLLLVLKAGQIAHFGKREHVLSQIS